MCPPSLGPISFISFISLVSLVSYFVLQLFLYCSFIPVLCVLFFHILGFSETKVVAARGALPSRLKPVDILGKGRAEGGGAPPRKGEGCGVRGNLLDVRYLVGVALPTGAAVSRPTL